MVVLTETWKGCKIKNTTFINHTGRWLKTYIYLYSLNCETKQEIYGSLVAVTGQLQPACCHHALKDLSQTKKYSTTDIPFLSLFNDAVRIKASVTGR
jgi:hypothetical protein